MSGADTKRADPREAWELAGLEASIGYTFSDRTLLELALQHASWSHENEGTRSNERLEFLGDSVIGFVVAHLLFEAHPDWEEGDLTRGLHALVDRRALAQLARDLGVGPHLRLGRTERGSAGEDKPSILADAMEALVAAVFLDGGIEPVRCLARRVYAETLSADAPRLEADPKTRFQEAVMKRYASLPLYELLSDSAVEGDERRFTVRTLVEGEEWSQGSGRSKREAERAAARAALAAKGESLDG